MSPLFDWIKFPIKCTIMWFWFWYRLIYSWQNLLIFIQILTLLIKMEVTWQVHKQNEEMQAKLLPFLPQDVNYKIKTFQLFHDSKIPLERQFYAEFEVNICHKEKFYEHFHDFCMITSTSWNKRRGKDMDNPTAPRRIFRGERKCHHNVRKVISKVTGFSPLGIVWEAFWVL